MHVLWMYALYVCLVHRLGYGTERHLPHRQMDDRRWIADAWTDVGIQNGYFPRNGSLDDDIICESIFWYTANTDRLSSSLSHSLLTSIISQHILFFSLSVLQLFFVWTMAVAAAGANTELGRVLQALGFPATVLRYIRDTEGLTTLQDVNQSTLPTSQSYGSQLQR
jgi:hypothetical protein